MKKLVVFGTGEDGHKAAKCISKSWAEIICFADNDSRKWTTKLYGKSIVDPDSIVNNDFDYVNTDLFLKNNWGQSINLK